MLGSLVSRHTIRCLQLVGESASLTQRCSTHSIVNQAAPPTLKIDPRWLSDAKLRIGRCMTFGLNTKQLRDAGNILQQLAEDWTELLVGSEGYLTGHGRAGLEKQAVVWGEMVCILLLHSSSH